MKSIELSSFCFTDVSVLVQLSLRQFSFIDTLIRGWLGVVGQANVKLASKLAQFDNSVSVSASKLTLSSPLFAGMTSLIRLYSLARY